MTSGSSSTTRSKPRVGHAPPSVTALTAPARRTSSSAKLRGPAATIGASAATSSTRRDGMPATACGDGGLARVELARERSRLGRRGRCALPARRSSASTPASDSDLVGEPGGDAVGVQRLAQTRRPLAGGPDHQVRRELQDGLDVRLDAAHGGKARRLGRPVAVARSSDQAVARADGEERLRRRRTERHDAVRLRRRRRPGVPTAGGDRERGEQRTRRLPRVIDR